MIVDTYCHVCNAAQHCRLGFSDFAGDLEGQINSGRNSEGVDVVHAQSAQSFKSKPRIILNKLGIETQVKSMMNNGSLSWIMISRGTNKYFAESYEEKEVPSYDEEMASGIGIEQSIATKQREPSSRPPNRQPRRSYCLTNGSGMIFQPRMTSWKEVQLGESRR